MFTEPAAPRGPYRTSLITLLQEIQKKHGYLPEDELKSLSRETNVSLMELYRLATFYHSFKLDPPAKHKVTVCTGTACHVRGSLQVMQELSSWLGLGSRGGRTSDGEYALEKVNCLGACALAPLVTVDGDYYGNVTPKKAREMLANNSRHQVPVSGVTQEHL